MGTLSASDIASGIASTGKVVPGLVPVYPVVSYRLEYMTTGADGSTITASGLVSVPQRPLGAVSPVLGYLHGTTFLNAEAPSNSAKATEPNIMLASMGYLVVAPDYVGYGASNNLPHPYLQAAPSAATVVDMLTATQTWQAQTGLADNGQLTLVGYSEGAYMAMAAHRAMTANQSPHLKRLSMSVLGAGPYDVQSSLDGVLRLVRDEQPVLGALLNPGFLRYMGSSLRADVRRALLKQLIPGEADVALDSRFMDLYLADDVDGLDRLSNVHRWKPTLPVHLFHGKNDTTVTYGSSLSALRAMQAEGAANLVSLTDCTAQPSGHRECLAPFIGFALEKLQGLPR